MSDLTLPRQEFKAGSGGRGGDFPPLDPEDVKKLAASLEHSEFFPGVLGLRLVDARRGYSRLSAENTKRLCQPAMLMHGGASFTMADTAAAYALISIYGPKAILLTIEMKINYLEPVPIGHVEAEAFVLRSTTRNAYIEIDIWAAGKLAARATTTYAIRLPKSE